MFPGKIARAGRVKSEMGDVGSAFHAQTDNWRRLFAGASAQAARLIPGAQLTSGRMAGRQRQYDRLHGLKDLDDFGHGWHAGIGKRPGELGRGDCFLGQEEANVLHVLRVVPHHFCENQVDPRRAE